MNSPYSDNNTDSNQYVGFTSAQNYAYPLSEVFTRTFLFMLGALLITSIGAAMVNYRFFMSLLTNRGFFYGFLIFELALVISSNHAIQKNKVILGGVLFALYSLCTGFMLSVILSVYTQRSVMTAVLTTSAVFAIMAVMGVFTQKDLTSWGSLLIMFLIGIIISSVVNLVIFKNDYFDLLISVVSLIIFLALTAYDTNKIKKRALNPQGLSLTQIAMFGAFELYLDFINILLKILRVFGKRK